jgi:hypothetical protein
MEWERKGYARQAILVDPSFENVLLIKSCCYVRARVEIGDFLPGFERQKLAYEEDSEQVTRRPSAEIPTSNEVDQNRSGAEGIFAKEETEKEDTVSRPGQPVLATLADIGRYNQLLISRNGDQKLG